MTRRVSRLPFPRSRAAGLCAGITLATLLATPMAAQQEKAAEDPTKIATKAGLSYSDEFSVSGSLAFGPVTKVNARVSESGQWSLGASYLFSFGILTFTAGKNEFDNGSVQTHYSLGGFVPLTAMGLKTGKWQLFTPFGYTYSEGEVAVTSLELHETVNLEVTNNSGYLGMFAIRPITEKFTFLTGGIYTRGSDDFQGVSLGGGLSYHLTQNDTVALFGSYIDNDFGEEQKLGISYRHEF
ncbi:hypothetical protein CLG85_007380 [Yangia mangrovi]|uniref:Outer membrane protein beta-barrel domain-containing protein n=2 Tax=Alloyangia mangrovi TaxID=1779329 RepID=A0ABT2KIG9_9RHOB|nr:hypothetical protein [Alloyangia mangrovi]MCA0938893.1 hypothetical protein [Alloyangia pacifica]MCA0944610.1 hypothetical protein [Alloyangia pacifica]MCT4370158.1 hypothetical protein [Alloyangia mangrovi]